MIAFLVVVYQTIQPIGDCTFTGIAKLAVFGVITDNHECYYRTGSTYTAAIVTHTMFWSSVYETEIGVYSDEFILYSDEFIFNSVGENK